jgi:uncharacterized protein Veg
VENVRTIASKNLKIEQQGLNYTKSLSEIKKIYQDNIGKSVMINITIPYTKKEKYTIVGILKNVYSTYITIETDKGVITAMFHDILSKEITIKI